VVYVRQSIGMLSRATRFSCCRGEIAGERENQLLSLWHRPYHPEAYRQSQAGR